MGEGCYCDALKGERASRLSRCQVCNKAVRAIVLQRAVVLKLSNKRVPQAITGAEQCVSTPRSFGVVVVGWVENECMRSTSPCERATAVNSNTLLGASNSERERITRWGAAPRRLAVARACAAHAVEGTV